MKRYRFTQIIFPSVLLVMLHATVCQSATITFDFAQSDFGWVPGFADYPADADPDFYELQSDYRSRPANLGGDGSIFISGSNHSDDLFMFIKKSLAGLQPNSLYRLTFTVELASQYAHGLGGIGGAPGDSVFLKAGASRIEPTTVIDQSNWYRMNIDKGNQAGGGRNALVLGTIAKPDDGTDDYVLIQHDNATEPVYAWTNASALAGRGDRFRIRGNNQHLLHKDYGRARSSCQSAPAHTTRRRDYLGMGRWNFADGCNAFRRVD